jgi:hypothetical protein
MRANLQTNLLLPLPKQPGHEKFHLYGAVAFAVLGVVVLASHMGWSELAAAIPKGSQQL